VIRGVAKRSWPLAAPFLLAYALYALTLFPGVGGHVNRGDSSKFQFIGVIAGVSHPPGNPLYLLLNVAAVHLLWFVEPWRVAAHLSALFGALAVAFTFDGVRRLRGVPAAAAAAGALGLGPLFWTLATEAEVYTLNALLLALCLWGLARWTEKPEARWLGVGLAAFVLAFANHLTIVAAVPALALVALLVHRRGGIPRALWLVGAGASVVAVALYLYVPLRAPQARYTELEPGYTAASLYDYVTARKFQGSFAVPSLARAVTQKLPELGRRLAGQWPWPMLLVAAAGGVVALRRARVLGAFVLVSAAGFLVFAFLYSIPDPEGFYIPVVTLLAPLVGLAVPPAGERRRWAALGGLAVVLALLAPAALTQVRAARAASGYDALETMTAGPRIPWDLPDVVARIPADGRFVLPCSHYGCVEVFNYFRFADHQARRKHIAFVHLDGGMPYPLPSPPRSITPEDARAAPTCSIRPEDARAFERAGAAVRRIDRAPAVPLYCASLP
jgi:hypothetical protein